jgi:DNA-binding CsgD family transcriptional regulator/tetratricopeptide (TPR) repeat protein
MATACGAVTARRIGQVTHSPRVDNAGMGNPPAVADDPAGAPPDVSGRLAAARAAMDAGRWRDARDGYAAVLDVAPSATAMDGIGEALWWLGEPAESLVWRERAYTAFRRDGQADLAAMAALGIAITYQANFGNAAAAAGWAARAERASAGAGGALDGWVWMTRGYLSPDAGLARELNLRALDAARAAGDVDLELCALSGLGEALVARGDVDEGLAFVDEAMAGVLAGEYRRLETVVYICCDMLVACELAADLRRATEWCRVADRFIADYGCPFLYARCRVLYGAVLLTTGRWAAAEDELTQAIRMADGAGPAILAEAHARLAELRLRQGRLEEAEALLRGHDELVVALRPAAAARLARGQTAVAVGLLERRLRHPAKCQTEDAATLALLVEALLAHGDPDAAAAAAARLDALPAATRGGHAGALATFAAARVAAARGSREAPDALAAAADRFAALGLPHEAARVRLTLARAVSGTQPAMAVAEATAALTAFRRLGAAADADACAALLRSLGASARAGTATGVLTGREREVLRLIALGLSNPEIAERLFISRKTAAHHVSNILAKLGVRNRAEAVAHAAHSRG